MKECASGTTLGFRPWSRWMMPLVIHLPPKEYSVLLGMDFIQRCMLIVKEQSFSVKVLPEPR